MKLLFIFTLTIFIIQESVAPPISQPKKEESENEVDSQEPDELEYRRYLEEVIYALESDPGFRDKLFITNETDIRNGKLADELEYVSHNVRTKLDELKRAELERLRHLAVREYELNNGLQPTNSKRGEHLDETNPNTFEIYDLKKLIAKTTQDLEEADKRRREEFKQYEMHKKFEQEEKMKQMNDVEKQKYETELHDLEKKHKDHEPLHHPGSKKQLEEVWSKQDHMENQDFDPRTFFFLHDLDGNGVWDQTELKTLFLKELDKLYAEGHPEDDLVERAEELERMREHVIREADVNKDGLISYEEFLNESKKAEFEKDPGWEPLDEQQLYSEQEYEEYKRQRAKEIEKVISQRMFPPHPNQGHPKYPQQQPQYQQVPMQQQQQQYPQQAQYMNQMPAQNGQYNNQIPQHQMPPQHVPYSNQMPQQQLQYNQMPSQQVPYNQMPPQQGQLAQQQQQQGQFIQQQQQQQPQQQQQGQFIQQQQQQQSQQHQGQFIQQQQQQQPQQQQGQFIQQQQQQPQQQQFQQAGPASNFNQGLGQQNYPQPVNQQVPAQHQIQQPQVLPDPNQIHREQYNVPAGQQQNQQHIETNNVNQNPSLGNQQQPGIIGQNQPNTQNQVPQKTPEQVSSLNNAQVH